MLTPQEKLIRRRQSRVTKAVRNIMFNELGLSRDSVEREITGIVRRFASDKIDSTLDIAGMLQGFVSSAIYGKWNSQKLQAEIEKQVDAEIKRQVAEYVKNELDGRLKITIEEKK